MLPNDRQQRFTLGTQRNAQVEHVRLQNCIDEMRAAKFFITPDVWKMLNWSFKELKRRQKIVGNLLRSHGVQVLDDSNWQEEDFPSEEGKKGETRCPKCGEIEPLIGCRCEL